MDGGRLEAHSNGSEKSLLTQELRLTIMKDLLEITMEEPGTTYKNANLARVLHHLEILRQENESAQIHTEAVDKFAGSGTCCR